MCKSPVSQARRDAVITAHEQTHTCAGDEGCRNWDAVILLIKCHPKGYWGYARVRMSLGRGGRAVQRAQTAADGGVRCCAAVRSSRRIAVDSCREQQAGERVRGSILLLMLFQRPRR